MSDKKHLSAIGIKRKGESEFKMLINDGWLKEKIKTEPEIDIGVSAHIIHNGTDVQHCGKCGAVIPRGQCVCYHCGESLS